MPSRPLKRISQSGPVKCLTCGAPTRSHALQPECGDQPACSRKPRPHVGGERIQLPVHGFVQSLDTPSHEVASYSMRAMNPSRFLRRLQADRDSPDPRIMLIRFNDFFLRLRTSVECWKSPLQEAGQIMGATPGTASGAALFKRDPAVPVHRLAARVAGTPLPGQAGSALIPRRFLASRPHATPSRWTGSPRSRYFSA